MYYSIGEFSKLSHINIYTLRYYEQKNLISPDRNLSNGRRLYSEKDILWINFIKRLKDTKMPIKDIQTYSYLRSLGDSTLNERMNLLEDHRTNLQFEIDTLLHHLKKLDDKIDYYKTEISKKKTIK
ncbi:MAG: MerR family transcriptional regulator [Clostridium sp.]